MDRLFNGLTHKVMSAEAAAALIGPNMTIACSGFTMVGYPKVVPAAIASLGIAENLTLLTGASVGDPLDGVLSRSGLISHRFPYQTNKSARSAINQGIIFYADQHLSQTPILLHNGGPSIDFAIIECTAVTEQGLIPAATVGASDSYVRRAKQVIVELNSSLPVELCGMHDIHSASLRHTPIPLTDVMDRIGTTFIPCSPDKIAAIVLTDNLGTTPVFKEIDSNSQAIAHHIVSFLSHEISEGRQSPLLSPLQSGVGSVANAVLSGLSSSGLTGLRMFTEVIQDSALNLIRDGTITGASCTAISLSESMQQELYDNLDYYREKIVIRSQEISNHPELVRRLGLISMNTPIECDIYGNVNSSHIMGSHIMNGIGGSGDFARNAGLTIFATSSIAKNGAISCIVPMVSHVDHTEHDVMVLVTEQGVADLRWKSPRERAELIIENCAHPAFRPALRAYYEAACREGGHTPHILDQAFSWHQRYLETGTMR